MIKGVIIVGRTKRAMQTHSVNKNKKEPNRVSEELADSQPVVKKKNQPV